MDNYKENWLPHLEGAIPKKAMGNKMSMYAIALEGWRRGLILRFRHTFNKKEQRIKVVYSLSYKGRVHKFAVSRGDKVSKEAINICINKDITKEYLTKAGVAVPKGKAFDESCTESEILEFASEIGYPVVLKPTDGMSGRGVIVNIKNEKELQEAIKYLRQELNYKKVIVESFIKGEDIRVYVIEDNVIGAISRIPANVIGDGKNSIRKLIREKNKERNKNPNHYKRPIKIDDELKEYIQSQGFTLDSVPASGKRVFLKKTSNISAGGEPIDVTDQLSSKIKQIAIDAAKAIPGLKHCAIDMMWDKENDYGAVIEINSKPQIGGHLFPTEGKARDIPKAIIDYYFPETINEFKNDSFYFDFDTFLEPLNNGSAKVVTVKKVPQYKPVMTCFEVTGKIYGVGYKRWIRRKAHSLRLNGFIKDNIKNGTTQIVIAGESSNVEKFRTIINSSAPKKAKIKKITETKWNKPVKMGFEIIDEGKSLNKKKLEYELARAKSKIEELNEEKEKYKSLYKAFKNSRTYKYTKPVRKVISVIRGK